ncbi:MAG: zinc-ribbon domain-containing protein, partial [Methanobacteriota archaeon]
MAAFCPKCGRHTSPGSVACAYCGTRMTQPGQGKKSMRLTCAKCGKRLPFADSLLDKKQTCKECDEQHARQLAYEREMEDQRRAMTVSEVIGRHPELRPKIMTQLGLTEFSGRMNVDVNSYERICQWDKCVTRAKNLSLARRFEDAAKEYESIAMWKEAGNVREKGSSTTVKHVNVNLNDLLDRVRDGGLAISYKCKSCGAGLSVD